MQKVFVLGPGIDQKIDGNLLIDLLDAVSRCNFPVHSFFVSLRDYLRVKDDQKVDITFQMLLIQRMGSKKYDPVRIKRQQARNEAIH